MEYLKYILKWLDDKIFYFLELSYTHNMNYYPEIALISSRLILLNVISIPKLFPLKQLYAIISTLNRYDC